MAAFFTYGVPAVNTIRPHLRSIADSISADDSTEVMRQGRLREQILALFGVTEDTPVHAAPSWDHEDEEVLRLLRSGITKQYLNFHRDQKFSYKWTVTELLEDRDRWICVLQRKLNATNIQECRILVNAASIPKFWLLKFDSTLEFDSYTFEFRTVSGVAIVEKTSTGLFLKNAISVDAALPYFLVNAREIIRKSDGIRIPMDSHKSSGLPLFWFEQQTSYQPSTANFVGILIGYVKKDKSKLIFLNVAAISFALLNVVQHPSKGFSIRRGGALRYFLKSSVELFSRIKPPDPDMDQGLKKMTNQVALITKSAKEWSAEDLDRMVAKTLVLDSDNKPTDETTLYHSIMYRILHEELYSFSRTDTGERETASRRSSLLKQLSRKLECTVVAKHQLRDAIGNPEGHRLSCCWILNMVFSFFLLIAVTCVNSHLLDLNFMMKPYTDSVSGCFYEALTECCQSSLQPADKPKKTCMRNEETYKAYKD